MVKNLGSTRCLVLGGTGFIGRHVVRALLKRGQNVRVLSRTVPDKIKVIFGEQFDQLEILEGDIANSSITQDALKECDSCIHLVGTTIPASSNEDKIFDIQSNLVETVSFLEAARIQQLRKMVYISSGGTVYGNPLYTPINEAHPTEPLSSYGITKLSIEKYFQLFDQLHGLKSVVLRLANPFGPGQRTQGNQGVVSIFLDRARHSQPIEIWGDGKNVRDFLYIDDAVLAILAALDYDGNETVFNIGSGRGTDLNSIVAAIELLLNRSIDVKYRPTRSLDVRVNVLDISRAAKHLDWRPTVTLSEGLEHTLRSLESK